jgi:hypothetical protein
MAAAVTATVVAAAATVGEAADFLFPKPAGPSLQRRLPRDISATTTAGTSHLQQ